MARKTTDTPGQLVFIAPDYREDDIVIRVPKDQPFSFHSPPAAPAEPTPMTRARLACGLLRSMELPDREFHDAVRDAADRGLDLVAFQKRIHGAFYHAFNSLQKKARGGVRVG